MASTSNNGNEKCKEVKNSSTEKWYFTKERLENTPSKQCGIEPYKELSYRQQAANFIQDMGQRLKVSQLCINTAIVYMHRFYVFHSFTQFPWHSIASASIFLAAKVEEQPRKLEHVIRVANHCKNPQSNIEITSDKYQAQSQDLVFNENVLLQTLGFDVAIDHPHTHVVKCCQLVRASKDLAQTSYFMASNSLHLTTMCLQYKPTVVACFCIHLVCKWSNWEIPLSNENREWFSYVDPTVTAELLQQLTEEFLTIFGRCPSRLKEKIMAISEYSPFESEKKSSALFSGSKDSHHRPYHNDTKSASTEDPHKHRSSRPHENSSSNQSQLEREYREKREAERMARHTSSKPTQVPGSTNKQPIPHNHHRPPVDPKLKQHGRPPSSSSGHPPTGRPEPHRDILKEATRDIGLRDYNDLFDNPNVYQSSMAREMTRDLLQAARNNEKDFHKRDFLLKPNVSKSLSDRGVDKRTDPSKSRPVDPSKIAPKHDSSKPYLKTENEIKKHLSSSVFDKNSAFLNKSVNSTSRKIESPFTPDTSKSVLKQNLNVPVKQDLQNGNNSLTLPLLEESKVKLEVKEEPVIPPPITKKPSLFSPEKSPPKQPSSPPINSTPSTSQLPPAVLPFDSPIGASSKRSRTVSSSSEPELRPVMKKIDQVEGFENLLRDSSIDIKVNHQVPDIITPFTDIKPDKQTELSLAKDLRPPDLIPPFTTSMNQPIVNGIETNPTLISNLLKETPKVPHLPTISSPVHKEETKEHKDKEHHHKERKKKNKEKHKHKDKDRSKEERGEKKKKHKDKDREKHKSKEKPAETAPAQPIKITISKDKIQPPEGLKIKIPKDRIKADNIGETSHPPGGIKIKISKDVINFSNENKKRERDRTSPGDAPPNKLSKSSYIRTNETKQNGRNSYSKVTQVGDGEASMHRLAESKYINKGAPT